MEYKVVWGPLPQSAFSSSKKTQYKADATQAEFCEDSGPLLHARHRAIEMDSSASHMLSPVCANPLFSHLCLGGVTTTHIGWMPAAAPAHHTMSLPSITSTGPYDFKNWPRNIETSSRTHEGMLPPAQEFLVDGYPVHLAGS